MALQQLTAEQVRTWTLEQKDRWWFTNVYRGDMAQLTLRSAVSPQRKDNFRGPAKRETRDDAHVRGTETRKNIA